MSVTIKGNVIRTVPEQVAKNMTDIAKLQSDLETLDLKEKDDVEQLQSDLAELGIKVDNIDFEELESAEWVVNTTETAIELKMRFTKQDGRTLETDAVQIPLGSSSALYMHRVNVIIDGNLGVITFINSSPTPLTERDIAVFLFNYYGYLATGYPITIQMRYDSTAQANLIYTSCRSNGSRVIFDGYNLTTGSQAAAKFGTTYNDSVKEI